MQPNSPLNPLQPMQPTVPGAPKVPDVPKVPDIPQIPKTPESNQVTEPQKAKETPKITGVSMPAGSNKKPESPTQRSEKINAANAPKLQNQPQKQDLLHKPVTMEEVEAYRKKSAAKKRTITICALVILAITGITTTVILAKNKQQSYNNLSSIYNDNLPIIINKRNSDGLLLLSQSGRVLSEKFTTISDFESDRTLATYEQDGQQLNAIISTSGKEIYSTESLLLKINDGQNYIISEEGGNYLLDKNGKKIDERPLVTSSYTNDQKYFLVSDENNYAVINSQGEEKIKGVNDRTTVRSFSYASNSYEDNYYCAFVINRPKDSKLYIYNCETAKEITNIENVYFMGGFEKNNSTFLTSEKGSSYFYNNEMIYNSDTGDTEYIGGIIKRESDNKFFNPVTRKSTESFPSDSLIDQSKLDEKTTITEDCKKYENRPESKLTQICSNIYYDNKRLKLSNDRFDYILLDEKLDDFLSFNNKSYFYRSNKTNQNIAIVNGENSTEAYSSIQTNLEELSSQNKASRFVVQNNNQKKTITELASGKSAEYESTASIRAEPNYYVVIDETSIRYFNAKHKQIYKEEF